MERTENDRLGKKKAEGQKIEMGEGETDNQRWGRERPRKRVRGEEGKKGRGNGIVVRLTLKYL